MKVELKNSRLDSTSRGCCEILGPARILGHPFLRPSGQWCVFSLLHLLSISVELGLIIRRSNAQANYLIEAKVVVVVRAVTLMKVWIEVPRQGDGDRGRCVRLWVAWLART